MEDAEDGTLDETGPGVFVGVRIPAPAEHRIQPYRNEQDFLWPAACELPPLSSEEVHVFAWSLDTAARSADWDLLGEDEVLRARRFVFPRDRDRFVRAHAEMRSVLAACCGRPPEEISFAAGGYGKPAMQLRGSDRIHFNLSHSGGIACLAVSKSRELGVDVEILRPIDPGIAEHHFSRRELATLRSLPAERWLAGFFRCWTSKEAILKGEGLGLNLPLDCFDVEADPQRAPALLACHPPAGLTSAWRLIELNPATGSVGALAVQDAASLAPPLVRCFSLQG